ncbi:MAG: type II/IV secretion system protein [Symploca sp. SIO2E6]|nr:type II/IV secretion system protein [Symploca sp. SIO2E6]
MIFALSFGSIPFWKKHCQKNDMARVSAILNETTRQNGMLPVIPLLLWRNCYYLGSSTNVSSAKIHQLQARTGTDIEVITIAEESYRDWLYKQKIDTVCVNSTHLLEFFKVKEEIEDISTFVEMYLLKSKDTTEQLNVLIASAMYNRASDIHLEPTDKGLRIRYRIDGMLRNIVNSPQGISRKLITALKVMSEIDITEVRLPQDGRIMKNYIASSDTELRLDMRVSTVPCMHGEKAVIRLLPQKNPFSSLQDLGFTQLALAKYNNWLRQAQGLVIITGPTGSGKTTTLYTSLQAVNEEFVNVVTIEDPVEYVLSGITQIQVNETVGMTLYTGLRSILRQDPDIVMVGEIRDEETAETAIRAALTGHLVFTTLHTNDAISAIPRIKGLKVDPYLINDALLGITAQRLVRKVCPHCAEPYKPTEEDLRYLGIERKQAQPEKWRKGRGCANCFNSGYLGRQAIIELLNIDPRVKKFIEGQTMTIQDYLNQSNFNSFRVAAIEKVTTGVTTIEELQRVLPENAIDSGCKLDN